MTKIVFDGTFSSFGVVASELIDALPLDSILAYHVRERSIYIRDSSFDAAIGFIALKGVEAKVARIEHRH